MAFFDMLKNKAAQAAQVAGAKAANNFGQAAKQAVANVQVESGGADSPRQIRLRTKPSTGEWFLWEQFILSDIRPPKSADPWA